MRHASPKAGRQGPVDTIFDVPIEAQLALGGAAGRLGAMLGVIAQHLGIPHLEIAFGLEMRPHRFGIGPMRAAVLGHRGGARLFIESQHLRGAQQRCPPPGDDRRIQHDDAAHALRLAQRRHQGQKSAQRMADQPDLARIVAPAPGPFHFVQQFLDEIRPFARDRKFRIVAITLDGADFKRVVQGTKQLAVCGDGKPVGVGKQQEVAHGVGRMTIIRTFAN